MGKQKMMERAWEVQKVISQPADVKSIYCYWWQCEQFFFIYRKNIGIIDINSAVKFCVIHK